MTTTRPTKKQINGKITRLGTAEKITRAMLSELSRDLLLEVVLDENKDVQLINRTLEVLTPMNKKTAALFFQAFTPFKWDDATGRFGKMDKKKLDERVQLINEFLSTEANDIWTWALDNVKVEKKPIDWGKRLSADVKKAIEADVDKASIIRAVMEGGLTAADVLSILSATTGEAA